MKIALVTDTYFPRINGVATSTQIFAEEFAKLGHEVHIYAPEFPNSMDDNAAFKVYRFPSMYLFFDPEDRLGLPHKDKKLVQQFIDNKYDIVHTQTPFTIGGPAVKWARKSGAKVVHTYHTLFAAYTEHYLWFLPKAVGIWYAKSTSRKYCNSCDLLITPSSEMKNVLVSYNVDKPIEVIPTGIRLERFNGRDGERYRKLKGYKPEDKLLLFMGRVAEEKNIDFLLKVVNRLRDKVPHLQFLIAGEGAAKKRLEKMVEDLDLSKLVHFAGYLSKEDWRDCYAGSDLFVFASITETQGLVVTEAMAAGTPVVAVGEMGIKDVMAHGKGGLVTKLNEDEFTDAVYRMMTDKTLYDQKKAETLGEADKWSSTSMAKRMLSAYEQLLKV
ncbi:MAG TPA: glycosyltransferase [bacterium]|nr:glycosyltransferase [bacterium]